MTRRGRGWVAALALAAVAAVSGTALAAEPRERTTEPRLVARAVLPADTFAAGPPSGTALGTAPINGRTPPFPPSPCRGSRP